MTWGSLESAMPAIWAHLVRGGVDRKSDFRWMQVATVDPAGAAQCRTVVLRKAIQSARTILFHTDRRSGKIADIRASGRAQLHIHSGKANLQLRLDADLSIQSGDDALAQTEWARLHEGARGVYAVSDAPGAEIATPEAALFNAEARDNFAVCAAILKRIEWLYLGADGHRRAVHDWREDAWQGGWIAP